ncbi:MAG: von Willebrand factor type A (vWA) domain protein [halophilic archaeon J07HX64]|jgi:Uncharacterized protein containing a von Willebrand factor type A (vWA) domain|nr:MAG: von Willebrand factor type A (vWA) domain protein [halophilic archaeon J07HX64]
METDTDFIDGEQYELTVTAVSGCSFDIGDTRVTRHTLEDEAGERFAVLVAPGSGGLVPLEPGETYRVRGLVGARPPGRRDNDAHCPSCGSSLRAGRAVDTFDTALVDAVERLQLTEPFGVVSGRTVITRVSEHKGVDDRGVDDWQPMSTSTPELSVPDYYCPACDRPQSRAVPADVTEREETEHQYEAAHIERMGSLSPSASVGGSAVESVGLATGGAKDVENFRENIEAGYTPQPEAMGDEGLFYDYYFETGESDTADSDALFAPRYATAVSEHPLTGDTERFLSVGLDSTLSVAEFERPRLDLVAVLDISGSMSSEFDSYYHDEHGRQHQNPAGGTTKLDAATAALCALTAQLRPEDRLGVVLYNNRAHVAKPLRDVGSTNMRAIREHIREVAAGGGTNLADGFEAAWDMLADGETTTDLERRVVFMTDMMPNTGATDERTLTRLFADAADEGIHTTFVGMGLDANADLADALSGVRGANHYFVNSAEEFEQRLGEEFAYMVTPLVYDLALELAADDAEIAAVHGSPGVDAASGQLMQVETLFPSAKSDGEARGGVVLVRLDSAPPGGTVDLVASWTERDGSEHQERATVRLPDGPEQFAHDGIRKAVALSRYGRELRAWARAVHGRAENGTGVDDWLLPDQLGEHERESVPLAVSGDWATTFGALREYLATEREVLGDETLEQELALLGQILDARDEQEGR